MLYARVRLHVGCLVLFLACQAVAQVGSARLQGVVRDPTGAVVPSARVIIVNSRTGMKTPTSTSSEGIFIFPSLQPGLYTLNVEAAGFLKTEVPELEVNVGENPQDVNLEIGQPTESIVVQARTERVQTADAQIAHAVTLRDIEVLPQLGRSPIGLGIFYPGIQTWPGNTLLSSTVNGSRPGSTNSRLDGIDVNDSLTPYFGFATTAFNTDSIEEFRIVTSGGKAEYGRNAGGQIELITRSGTNTWHGNAFEFLRNTALNANNFFNNSTPGGLSRPAFIQNRFGGSLGGPIRSNRTFIFVNYQGLRTAQQVVRNRLVLTPQAKKGLFRWKDGVEIRTFDIVTNDPRHIGIDPKVAEILKLLPDPNNYDTGDGLNTAGYRFNNPATDTMLNGDEDQFTIRADHNLSGGHRVFFRGTWGHVTNIDSAFKNDARYPGQPPALLDVRGWAFSIGSDWAITPRLINELRAGYKYYLANLDRQARLPEPMLLANSWTDPLNPAFSNTRKPPVNQITDILTFARSRHVLKGGIEGRFTTEWTSDDAGIWPNVTFATSLGNNVPPAVGPPASEISAADRTRFNNLYNDLLGRMNQVTQTFYSDLRNFQPAGTPRVRNYRFREFNAFFQDDWKIHPRLVLNFGLRYEFFGAPFETNGIQGIVDHAALINSTARIDNLTIQPGSQWYNSDFNNIAPRIGLAWAPGGSGKTALRAGWGIFYDRIIGATSVFVDANTPGFSAQVPVNPNSAGTDIRVSDGIPLPQPPTVPELSPKNTRATNLFLFNPNFRTPYVQHYNLSIQREIFRNTVIEAGYVGTHGVRLFMNLNLNQPRIYEDFLPAFRELQALRALTPASNTLVRIFGSPSQAITAMGTNLNTGAAGAAADSMDRNPSQYPLYSRAGLSDFYLRNYPQFNQVIVGTNDGRSYYNSFQLSLRRYAGALKFAANYTFSRSIDNIAADDNRGFTPLPIDNFNVRLNRGRGDYDTPHVFTASFTHALPLGRGRRFAGAAPRWVDSLIGGWDVGLLMLWQSGRVISYLSGYGTGPSTAISFANYTGDRNIGQVIRKADGVYWLTDGEDGEKRRFSRPTAGEIGTGGRNAFRGPRFFNVDMSLVKRFRINDRQAISFRAEAYNLFNNANFGPPSTDLSNPATFGKISSTVGNPRILQMALRYDF
jgi:hypothetical protein